MQVRNSISIFIDVRRMLLVFCFHAYGIDLSFSILSMLFSNSPFYRCFSNQSCDRPHRLARALPVYICTWDHAHRGPLPRLMYPTCKHAAHLYQMQVSASPCPLACDVAESLPGSNRGMRLVRPMRATRTACACAGIEYLAEAQRQPRSSGRGL